MESTQKLLEKLVERRMQNTGESQEVATANVLAAFEKLSPVCSAGELSKAGNARPAFFVRLFDTKVSAVFESASSATC